MLGELNYLRVQTRYRTHARPATLFELSRAFWKYLTNAPRLKINHFTKTLLLLLVWYRPITAFGVWVESERLPRVSCRVLWHTPAEWMRMNKDCWNFVPITIRNRRNTFFNIKPYHRISSRRTQLRRTSNTQLPQRWLRPEHALVRSRVPPGCRRNAITPRRFWFRTQQHYTTLIKRLVCIILVLLFFFLKRRTSRTCFSLKRKTSKPYKILHLQGTFLRLVNAKRIKGNWKKL